MLRPVIVWRAWCWLLLWLCVLCSLLLLRPAGCCTTIVVGRAATEDGDPLLTHNLDCTDCDIRLAVVPARSHPPSASCPVYPCKFSYPRHVGSERGLTYAASHLRSEFLAGPFAESEAIGRIVQVNVTFSYLDGSYPLSNEWGLSMGESTCSARFVAFGRPLGDALFDVTQLMRLAMERCRTARCAIQLMGGLAEEHGYYGSNDPPEQGSGLYEESGEAVTLIDAEGESWVFHILPDDTGRSAVWAAQRVETDELAIVANKFSIRLIDDQQPQRFLHSANMRDVAVRAGLWPANRSGLFDFAAAFAPDANDRTGWADRRTWQIFNRVAPSLLLQPERAEPFPFSVKVERLLTLQDVKAMTRDHFEGSVFDLSVGPAAGPFNNPNRYDLSRDSEAAAHGSFERAISLHRTSYAFVATARYRLPQPLAGVVWLCHHAPHSSLFVPLYSATQRLHESWTRGTLFQLRRGDAWWAFASVANVAEKMYSVMQTRVNREQEQLEAAFAEQLAALDRRLQLQPSSAAVVCSLTAFTVNATAFAVAAWWSLFDSLLCRYRDGQQLTALSLPIQSEPVGYSAHWLQQVGYYDSGDVPELHSDLRPPQPPHPQSAPSSTTLSSRPQTGRWHAALGRSWESGAKQGGAREDEHRQRAEEREGEGERVLQEAQQSQAVWAVVSALPLSSGRLDGGATSVLLLLLLLLAVLLAPVCWLAGFQAGARGEKRRRYETIAYLQN